ncbi:MAG: hypothetical protein KDA25_02885 [Phycisphaerales bacterium]|nr:hypothetical protein [Phycisphaerales bacterium]
MLCGSVAAAGVSLLPVDDGDLIATSFSGFSGGFGDPPDVTTQVVTVVDVRVPPVSGPPPVPGAAWNPPMFWNAGAGIDEWTAGNLGQVFGLAYDLAPDPNLYVAAGTNPYGDMTPYPWPLGGVGPDGPGAIYRIDGATGQIQSFVITTPTGGGGPGTNRMPTSRHGLGNVCYDREHDQLFATNFEDGRVYRIDMSGIILSTYDPFAPTTPVAGAFAPRGERPWAVQVHDGRLYFSVWLRDTTFQSEPWPSSWGPPSGLPNNTIWSIALDGSGDFLGAPVLEIVVPHLSTLNGYQYSNPVSDIAFSAAGDMMLAERTMIGDFGMIDVGHLARTLEYTPVGTTWTPSGLTWFQGNLINGALNEADNATGGVDYDCDGRVWCGADQIGAAGYGIQGIPPGGNTLATRISTSWLIAWPVNLKAVIGDVEVYRDRCDGGTGCEVFCPDIALPEPEPCGASTNPGCAVTPPLFTDVECGMEICGTAWAENGQRDEDWYRLFLPDTDGDALAGIRVMLASEFPGVVRIYTSSCPTPFLFAEAESVDCGYGTAFACLDAPGEYLIVVTPETLGGGPVLFGHPCGSGSNDYHLVVECVEPCGDVRPCDPATAGPCDIPHSTPGCDNPDCCAAVCAVEPFCCTVEWDALCVALAQDLCGHPCDIECDQSVGSPEGEPCGADVNHGCDADPPIFTGARCHVTYCGTAWAENGQRDTDWYQFDVPDDDLDGWTEIHARLTSEFPGVVRIHTFDCANPFVHDAAESDACMSGEAVACVPAPGIYLVSVKPETFGGGPVLFGIPCGTQNDYILDLQCVDCTEPPVGPCTPPPPSMVAWWQFDEASGPTAAEVVNGIDGTHVNGPVVVPGMVNAALDFDGVDDFVRVPDHPAINFSASSPNTKRGDFSIDAWIRLDQFTRLQYPIVDKRDDARGYFFLVHDGVLTLAIADGSGQTYHYGGGLVPIGVDVHVVVTVDRDDPNGITFYQDGAVSGSGDPTGRPGSLVNGAALRIGASHYTNVPGDGVSFFDGVIDEVEIFNRVLGASEVAALHGAGPAGKCRHCCYVPSWKPFCAGATSVIVGVEICNKSVDVHTFELTMAGLPVASYPGGTIDGPTGFTFIDPSIVTLGPGDCAVVRVRIDRPTDMVANGDTGCYEASVTNLDTGDVVTCVGRVVDRRKWCAVAIGHGGGAIPMAVATPRAFVFQIINHARPIGVFHYAVYAIDRDTGQPNAVVSLDGLPPGKPVSGSIDIAEGESAELGFEAVYTDYEPLRSTELMLLGDLDGDGVATDPMELFPVTSVLELSNPADLNGDGVVGPADLAILLSQWGPCEDPGNCVSDLDGDGLVGPADLAILLASWGG